MSREKDRTVTLFIDIDGTILKHQGDATGACCNPERILSGVLKKFNDWSGKGYCIVLTTARKESMREVTENQLRRVGLFWDLLIMGVGMGRRVVINDKKMIDGKLFLTAVGVNVERDEGFDNIDSIYTKTLNSMGTEGDFEL